MSAPVGLDVASYTDFAAVLYRTVTTGGATYSVIVAGEAGIALVQRDGCRGWTEISLRALGVDDPSRIRAAAAAIDAAFVP